MDQDDSHRPHRKRKVASFRLALFVVVMLAVVPIAMPRFGTVHGVLIGFDLAAVAFIFSFFPLLSITSPADLHAHATVEDGSREMLLAIASVVSVTVLGAVATEFAAAGGISLRRAGLVIVTLGLAWIFGNLIYALHYAHLHYSGTRASLKQPRGLTFPGTEHPDYWDFIYFSFTLGMTFQTSDVTIESSPIRRVVTIHSLAAFVFNLGILGFTINLLGGLGGH
jgi:uncharacterized membrane protein